MMVIQQTVLKAMMNVFSALIIEDYCPKLEFEDGSLTLWTEDASCEAVLVVNRSRSLFGEQVFSLEIVPGEGERYLAEMVADEVVEIVKGGVNDE
jgi:hypothetical protein